MSEHRKSVFGKTDHDHATARRVKAGGEIRKDKRASIFVTKRKMIELNSSNTDQSLVKDNTNLVLQSDISSIIDCIMNVANLKESLTGLQSLRITLCADTVFEESFIIECIVAMNDKYNCRCIDVLIQYLAYYKNEAVQSDAIWCITNLLTTNLNEEQLNLFLPAIPICLHLLSYSNNSASAILKEQCCWAIGNIVSASGECDYYHADSSTGAMSLSCVVIANGALYVISEYLYYTITELKQLLTIKTKQGSNLMNVKAVLNVSKRLQTVLWTFCNLIRKNDGPVESVVTGEKLVETIFQLMNHVEHVTAAPYDPTEALQSPAVNRYFTQLFELLTLPFLSIAEICAVDDQLTVRNCFFLVMQETLWVTVYLTTKSNQFIDALVEHAHLSDNAMLGVLNIFGHGDATQMLRVLSGMDMQAAASGLDDLESLSAACVVPLLRVFGNISVSQSPQSVDVLGLYGITHGTNVSTVSSNQQGRSTHTLTFLHQIYNVLEAMCAAYVRIDQNSSSQVTYYIKDMLWVTSNIIGSIANIANSVNMQYQSVQQNECDLYCIGVVRVLMQLLCHCNDYHIQKEVIVVLQNALSMPRVTREGVVNIIMMSSHHSALVELSSLLATPRTTDVSVLIALIKIFASLCRSCESHGTNDTVDIPSQWLSRICEEYNVLEYIENISYIQEAPPQLNSIAVECVEQMYSWMNVEEEDGDGVDGQDRSDYYGSMTHMNSNQPDNTSTVVSMNPTQPQSQYTFGFGMSST